MCLSLVTRHVPTASPGLTSRQPNHVLRRIIIASAADIRLQQLLPVSVQRCSPSYGADLTNPLLSWAF